MDDVWKKINKVCKYFNEKQRLEQKSEIGMGRGWDKLIARGRVKIKIRN